MPTVSQIKKKTGTKQVSPFKMINDVKLKIGIDVTFLII